MLGTVPLLAQTPDEARIFLGEGPPAASEAATERLDAAWRRLLVGPRFERTEARREIVAMGPAAARRLISELSGDSGEARRQAALTLGRIDLPEVRAALRRAVTGEKGRRDETLLCHAALALADQGERDAAPELLAQISRVKRPRTRRFLILALARLGEPETARHLVDLADRDRSLEFRATLVLALGLSEGHEADRHLDAAVKARRDPVRRAAALALTWRGDLDPRVLARLLGDDDARVAETALLAIATGAAGEGLEPARLVRWLRHEEPALRSAAALAAARAEAPDPLLARLETESDPAVRAALYFALRPAAGDEAVAARLAAGLEESAREPREAALLALALGGAAGLDLEAIARGRGARGLEMLALDLLAGRDPERAAAAAQALLGPEARASEELAARAGELLAGVAPAETRRRKAALRCQLRIDDLGLSPSWRLSGLAHALLLEIEGLDRPLDGRESIRVGAGGEARAIPRMNAEEEDLRLWFDRHPLLDRRRQREVPGLGVR